MRSGSDSSHPGAATRPRDGLSPSAHGASSPREPAIASPRISVVLPTLNGERELERLLPALAAQEVEGGLELCAIDSSSEDRSLEMLQAAGAKVETIPRADFGHGKTRNQIASMARGETLVFLSQDVVPADEHALEQLVTAFDDERVAGATARVLPFPDDDPLTARTVLALPESSEEPVVRDLDHVAGVWELEPEERARYLRFNNVASAIRRSVFEELPFPDLSQGTGFGEDFAWAARALSRGWRIAYVPESVVYHAHAYHMRQAYERYRVDAAFHRDVHGFRVRPTVLSLLRGFAYEVGEDLRYVLKSDAPRKLHYLLRSPGLRAAMMWGQFSGSRGPAQI